MFYAWLTQDLLPKVKSEAVIVMNNATFHKRKDILKAIKDKGCVVEFLPPYGSDLNPIEKNGRKQNRLEESLAALSMSCFLNTC